MDKPVHWSQIERAAWDARWPHFSPQEMSCRATTERDGAGLVMVDPRLMDALERLRTAMGGRPLNVVSGYRTPAHNRAVGGAPASYHMRGMAADVSVANHDPASLERMAIGAGFRGIGRYPRQGFIHLDVGPARFFGAASWGQDAGLAVEPHVPVGIAGWIMRIAERFNRAAVWTGLGIVSALGYLLRP